MAFTYKWETLEQFKNYLEDVEEEIEYEDIKLADLAIIKNKEAIQTIVEKVKEDVISELKKALIKLVQREMSENPD